MHYLDKFRFCPACGSSRFRVNDSKSKRCDDCSFTFYYNSAAATVAIIENEKGEILVARRAFEPAKGTLDIIGGFVDPGERTEEAIVREIKEEIGVEVSEDQLSYLFSLPNTYEYSNFIVRTTDSFFHLHLPSTTPLFPKDDVAACWWVKKSELNTDEIGLDSIRRGMEKWLGHDD